MRRRDIAVERLESLFDEAMLVFDDPDDDVRSAADPRAMLLEFFQSTYEAAATLGRWDRENLERTPPR